MSRTKISLIAKIAVLVVYFLLVFIVSRAQVTSDFSANDEGWTVFNSVSGLTSTPVYNSSGGNPGGYISATVATPTVQLFWNAPAKFLGNFNRAYNQTISFDLLQGTLGTDNTQNDLEIIGGGLSVIYQLPVKPGTTWTHYSIQFNENITGWHTSSLFGPAPTQGEMKKVLSNITSFKIRLKYNTTSSSYTAQLDNVVLNLLPLGTPPVITSISPAAALTGATVTVTGSNFNSTPSQNVVNFNGVKANVTSASATQLQVKVPTSAGYGPITVLNLASGLQGSSAQSFNPLFDNNKDFGGRIIPASLGRGNNVVLPMSAAASNGFGRMDKGDLDGDGRIDLVTTETSTAKIYSFQNLGIAGAVSTSSFGSGTALPSLSSIPGGGPYLSEVIVVDVDNDGKLDVAASTANNSTGFLAVYRNTSSVGSISFANPVFFAYNYYSALSMATGDLDGDGRTDFAFTTGTAPGNIFLSQNLSTPGNIDFSFGVSLSAVSTSGLSDIAIADLTGDGKPEIICPGYNAATISIYQNNSTAGSISMGAAFTIPSVVAYTNQIAVADFDADGKLDMTWSTYGAQYVYLVKNIYSGAAFDATAFGPTIQVTNKLSNPLGITVGDINADGKTDIVLSGYNDLAVMQNIGTGSLSANSFLPTTLFQGSASASSIFGLSPAVADLDGDNKSEVVFVSSGGTLPAGATGIYVFHNESYPVPSVTNLSPTSGQVGALVSMTGSYMYTGNNNPTVRMNRTLANLSGTPTNSLSSVTLPVGSISGKFNITNHGLTSFSSNFPNLFNTDRVINATSFGPSVDFTLAFGLRDVLETADFDDDGKTDVVISDGSGVRVFQNATTAGQSITASSLTKTSPTYTAGANVIVYDIDGDGKTDLNGGGSQINQNTSSGSTISFAANVFAPIGNPNGTAAADFNKDGKIDVAITNGSANIQLFENLSSRGSFTNGTVSTYNTTPTNLAQPNGKGFSGSQSIVSADFDGDGYDDLAAISSTDNTVSTYLNKAVFGFISSASFSTGTTIATASQPYGITASDFDGDGKIDMAVVHYNSTAVNVYLNTSVVGTISFAAPVNLTGGVTFGYNIGSQDLDGDGKAEIVTTRNPNPGTPSFSVFQNNSTPGTLSFKPAITYAMARNPQALAFADINSDSKPDILIAAYSALASPAAALMVFQNNMNTPVITISTQPTSIYSVCDGATPAIATAATGTTNITYQWQYSSNGIVPFTDLTNTGGYSNVATSSLTINSTGNFGAGIYRCKVNGDFAATVYTNTVSFTVNALPTKPTTSNVSNCGPGSVTLTASGGTNGQYLWYDQNGLITGQNNNTYTTPSISATSSYSVAITNGTCVSTKVSITATINAVPAAPGTQGASACQGKTISLTATGATNGQYRWYTAATGGTAINGEVNSTYTTPTLTASTTYYVSINNGTCESTRTAALATVTNCAAPVIKPDSVATQIGGKITLDLKPLITTANLDLSSLQIITPPSSGATASIDANGILTIDYSGKAFSGTEKIKIQACDLNGQCAVQDFSINVAGDIVVYNGISPDGANPKLLLQYIEVLPETKNNSVYIFDRWENLVWHGSNYDNTSVVFTGSSDGGSALPSGVYFYKISFASGRKTQTGFISLRR